MKVLVLPIGKMRSRPLAELAAEYAKRLSHYLPLEVCVCRDERALLGKIEPADGVVLLDARGEQVSSEELAAFIAGHQRRGTKRLLFCIGGPEGFGPGVRSAASMKLALSRMTFPHELAQVVLLEQLYRGCSILKGEPYHK